MKLLEPFPIGPLTLPSRVVVALLAGRPTGLGKGPTKPLADRYAECARAGLIISEATEVDPGAALEPTRRPGLYCVRQAKVWRRVVDRVRAAGGRIFVQLSHEGRSVGGARACSIASELTLGEIPPIVDQFVNAALLARDAGFDGVEIHGADGHLIDQFLRSGSNRRSDAYGGSARKRARFLLEVTEAIAAVWGVERVGVRLSPWNDVGGMSDEDPAETFGYAAEALDQVGIAYLHLVEPARHQPSIAPALRRKFGGALIVAGGSDRNAAEATILSGTTDLVAFGESDIANPDLSERLRRGALSTPTEPPTSYAGGASGSTAHRAPGATL